MSEEKQDTEGVKRGSVTQGRLRPGAWRPI